MWPICNNALQYFVVLPHNDAPALLIVLVNAQLQDVIFCVDVCSTNMLSSRWRSMTERGRVLTELLVDFKLHRQPMTIPPESEIAKSNSEGAAGVTKCKASYPNLRGQ